MIRVAVELWPGGGAEGKETLREVFIHNLGTTDTPRRGNYGVRTGRFGPDLATVEDYPRQAYSPLELVFRALKALREAKGGRL